MVIRIVVAIAAAGLPAACAPAQLPAFERALAAQDSATAALGQWCATRHLANLARITASAVHGADAPQPADLPRILASQPATAIGYRHVRLSCGSVVLSEAHNWYLPADLSPAMNAALATSDTPFGTVVAALHFIRQPLGARRGAAAPCPASTILSHRALLRLPGGAPLALVVECYTAANLQRP